MSAIALGAVVTGIGTMATLAAPGQCTVTGYDSFPCEVTLDGGGLTFGLPDGQTFAFALVAEGKGQAYRISPDAGPGRIPDDLGTFKAVEDEAGCWASTRDEFRFCVLVQQ